MKNLNISVVDKIAKYLQRDGAIVCGNSDYQITFTFDAEWDAYETKTARFIWNGKYWDQPIKSDNTCEVPKITNAVFVLVGVYAGDLSTTTPASIPCKRSILCDDVEIYEGNVPGLRDQAVDAAYRAEVAAARVEAILAKFDNVSVLGYVDENKVITLRGNLALDDTYTFKYVKADGTVVEIGKGEYVPDTLPKNFADTASEDWKEGYRLTSNVDEITALTGGVVTNYIYPQKGDVIEVSGINIADSNSRTAYWFNSNDNNILKSSAFGASTALSDITYDANSMTCTVVADCDDNARIRFSGLATGTSADVVINIKRNGEWLTE